MTDLPDLEDRARWAITQMIENIDPDAPITSTPQRTGGRSRLVVAVASVVALMAAVGVYRAAGTAGEADVATTTGPGASQAGDDPTAIRTVRLTPDDDGIWTVSGTTSSDVAEVRVVYTVAASERSADGEVSVGTSGGDGGQDERFAVELPDDARSTQTELQIVALDENATEIGRRTLEIITLPSPVDVRRYRECGLIRDVDGDGAIAPEEIDEACEGGP